MAMVLTEVALQRVIQIGIANLRANPAAFREVFAQYSSDAMKASYGEAYIDKIQTWFNNTKLPVLQAWSFDPQKVPAISIHLADESEDESKASVGDYFGMGEDSEILVGTATVSLDIGIHADKTKDIVLWMYYIVVYILYKEKLTARGLGLLLYTYRANEYNKESKYMADNVWSRWVRFKCTVQHYVDGDNLTIPTIDLDVQAESLDSENDIVSISHIVLDDE
ncbi:hypothetical protein UFOVP53_212 [uncultured Caudovirales phage]|uniref:Uncharacterized protein n=1 Tax=uncultured Caudovirales phage TaxID=2100421 RepID=A0A6J5KWM4_9CAUD|nr:hypothetical protein UFOVP53_212 [uncultured Caudovirales phage]